MPLVDREGEASVFILVEHQSTPDPLMAVRVLIYAVETSSRFIERHRAKTGRAPRRLPAAIPLVVHQGRRPWSGPRSLAEAFDLSPALQAVLGEHLPRLTLLIDDLAVPDGERGGRTQRALTAAALLAMRAARTPATEGLAERLAALISASLDEPGRAEVVATVVEYLYTQVDQFSPSRLLETIDATDAETKEVLMTVADRLRAEGRAEGRVEGRADAILELIRQRLGEPSAALAARVVADAGGGTGPWFERILAASDLADLEAGFSD